MAIDWSFLGTGAAGGEIGPMMSANLLWSVTPPRAAGRLEAEALGGYRRGLAERGLRVDARSLRAGYCATVALRTAYITLSGTGQLAAMDWPDPGLRLNFQG